MKESSIKILLAEFHRINTAENSWRQTPERSIQFYLAVITLAAGGVLFFFDKADSSEIDQLLLGVLLSVVALLGEITFLKLVGFDFGKIGYTLRYQMIWDEFIKLDPQLAEINPNTVIMDSEKFQAWSSLRGIIRRAIYFSGDKTTVVILNSLVIVGLVINFIRPGSPWVALFAGIFTLALVVGIHIIYTSWRYKQGYEAVIKEGLFWKM